MKKFRIEMKWALIFALMTLAWMLLEKLAGFHGPRIDKHVVYTNFYAIPAIAVYVFALLDKRKNYYEGQMSYKQGVMAGLIMTLFVTILSPTTQYIVSEFITPEYFPNAIAYAVSEGKMMQEAAAAYFSLKNYMVQSIIGAPVMGIITTLVVAFFTKTRSTRNMSMAA